MTKLPQEQRVNDNILKIVQIDKQMNLFLLKNGQIFYEGTCVTDDGVIKLMSEEKKFEKDQQASGMLWDGFWPLVAGEKIIDLAGGSECLAIVTSQGNLYAKGRVIQELDSSILTSESNAAGQADEQRLDCAFKIELPNGYKAKQVWTGRTSQSMFVTAVAEAGGSKKHTTFFAGRACGSTHDVNVKQFRPL